MNLAVHLKENDDSWWARLGYARECANDLKWAADAYARALKLDPGLVDAQRGKESVDKKLRG